MRIWLFTLLASLAVACGGSQTQAVSTPTPDTPGVSVRIVATDAGFQARSQDSVAVFRLSNSGGKSVELDRDPQSFDHTLNLNNLTEASDDFLVEALDGDGTVLAHYKFSTSIPAQVVVHVDRFQPGNPGRVAGIGEFVEQYRVDVPGNPGLTETYWNAAVDVPPPFRRSKHDIIGLHRLARPDARPGRVLLFLPGAQCNGTLYTTDETRDFRLWLANRGYEVYSLDYRVHFAPPFNLAGVDIPGLVTPDLSFMAPWNGAAFISDTHTAIEFIQATSAVDKIFLSGFSSGGQVAYYYACSDQGGRLGQDDLLGLIVLDGGPWEQGTGEPPETFSFQVIRDLIAEGPTPENIKTARLYGSDPGDGYYSVGFGSLASDAFLENVLAWLLDPASTSPTQPDETAEAYIVNRYQNNWGTNPEGDGQFTNIQRGSNDLPTLLAWSVLAADTYWPLAFTLDDAVISNFKGPNDGPFKVPVNAGGGLHYLDKLSQVNVPQFVLGSGGLTSYLYNSELWKQQGIALSSSTDTEFHIVPHVGHLDMLSGSTSNQGVAQPMLEWLDKH